MRRLTTAIRSEKCVVRRFRCCANVYLHTVAYPGVFFGGGGGGVKKIKFVTQPQKTG
jgi:hypothetical protein